MFDGLYEALIDGFIAFSGIVAIIFFCLGFGLGYWLG